MLLLAAIWRQMIRGPVRAAEWQVASLILFNKIWVESGVGHVGGGGHGSSLLGSVCGFVEGVVLNIEHFLHKARSFYVLKPTLRNESNAYQVHVNELITCKMTTAAPKRKDTHEEKTSRNSLKEEHCGI